MRRVGIYVKNGRYVFAAEKVILKKIFALRKHIVEPLLLFAQASPLQNLVAHARHRFKQLVLVNRL